MVLESISHNGSNRVWSKRRGTCQVDHDQDHNYNHNHHHDHDHDSHVSPCRGKLLAAEIAKGATHQNMFKVASPAIFSLLLLISSIKLIIQQANSENLVRGGGVEEDSMVSSGSSSSSWTVGDDNYERSFEFVDADKFIKHLERFNETLDARANESFHKLLERQDRKKLRKLTFNETIFSRKTLNRLMSRDKFNISYQGELRNNPEISLVILYNDTSIFITQCANKYYYWEFGQTAGAAVIFIMIVVGNLSILHRLKSCRRRRSNVNYFIVQLAIADLCVGFFNVTLDCILRLQKVFVYGQFACLASKYISVLFIYSSTYLLVALSIDRWEAVVKPLAFTRNRNRGCYLVLASWALACLLAIPATINTGVKEVWGLPQCYTQFDKLGWQIYMVYVLATIVVIPSLIISICYIQIVYTIWSKGRLVTKQQRQRAKQRQIARGAKVVGTVDSSSSAMATISKTTTTLTNAIVKDDGKLVIGQDGPRMARRSNGYSTSSPSSSSPQLSTASTQAVGAAETAGGQAAGIEQHPPHPLGVTYHHEVGHLNIVLNDEQEEDVISQESTEDEYVSTTDDDDHHAFRRHSRAGIKYSITNQENGGSSSNNNNNNKLEMHQIGHGINNFEHQRMGTGQVNDMVREDHSPTTKVRHDALRELDVGAAVNQQISSSYMEGKEEEEEICNKFQSYRGQINGNTKRSSRPGRHHAVARKRQSGGTIIRRNLSEGGAGGTQQHGSGVIPKARIKTIKMTLVIVIAYILCWSPFCIINLCAVFELIEGDSYFTNALMTLSQSLAHLNSAVNPIIFWLFSSKRNNQRSAQITTASSETRTTGHGWGRGSGVGGGALIKGFAAIGGYARKATRSSLSASRK